MTRCIGEPASAGPARASAETHAPTIHRAALVLAACAAFQVAGSCMAAAADAVNTPAGLARLSIEELAEIEVSSVSKRPERLADAPAAVYVITRDDIRRSAAWTLPELLRLAPNLEVARTSSNGYAISARGFNGSSANKLLVMIDGRTVYTPLHSGVFWDVQDVVIADIERIEVVSGPGGTLWGANAVNGVINVITRSALQSVGTIAAASAGNDERGITVRHGVALGEDAAVRGYVKSWRFDASENASGQARDDAWDRQQVGFRADFARLGATLQGDAYQGDAQGSGFPDRHVTGSNLLGRWTHDFDDKSGLQVQAYVDTYKRVQPNAFSEHMDTYDFDAQHRFSLAGGHEIVWGGGLREQHDHTEGSALLAFVPADNVLRFANLFAQDTWSINPRTKLTLGLKAERNSYTGLEYQPNVRIGWKPDETSLLWAAASRAVRTPSRLDRDFYIFIVSAPPFNGRLLGGSNFMSERVMAYELGYRSQPSKALSYSVTAFVNDYDRLRSFEATSGGDFTIGNNTRGRTHGVEAWGAYQVNEDWRLNLGLTLLGEDFSFEPGSADPGVAGAELNDPKAQLSLRSSWSLPRGVSLDAGLRRVGSLPHPTTAAYTAVDARLAWRFNSRYELSLVGFNLLGGPHAEFGSGPNVSMFGRSIALRFACAL
jgi:iron complex outermembrane receptor protein